MRRRPIQKKLTAAQDHLESLKAEAEARKAVEALQLMDATALEEAKANETAAKQARRALERKLKADKRKSKET